MATECSACCSPILDSFFMECSNDKCVKRYDLKCLNIIPNAFNAYTLAYKRKWVCPNCICLKPKCGNMETPLRKDLNDLAITTTPQNNVNTQRGSQAQFSPVMMDSDVDATLLVELKQFRSDIIARLDSQANAIKQLQYQFSLAKNDLNNLVKIIAVVESRVTRSRAHQSPQVIPEEAPSSSPATFAEAVTLNANPTQHKKIASSQKTAKKQNINKSVATKSTASSAQENVVGESVPTTYILSEQGKDEDTTQGGWTTVQNKRVHRASKNIGIGKNTELKAIQATERKKHLHVWRLHPETTEEAMTNHIKSICGQDIILKVQKIKHKTERDYASFVIGVPERMYDDLNKAEVWPVNAEFNEWVWFRKQSENPFNK
ncbi:hypothetical protein HF086_015325 [Spodoptera exigua]|uniref:Uncharacterized protein n=1 Tax=Spodoptera exigua TaxID=7107 RepID=A0A922M091_SPOEX|nr:hypothetical protein HF086_015325 [Spodoptera exigua]